MEPIDLIRASVYLERARIFLRLRLSLRIRFLRHCLKKRKRDTKNSLELVISIKSIQNKQ